MNALTREALQELLKNANIKPRIRRELRFAPEEITDWNERDFLAVTNRSQSEGVLIVPLNKLYVVSFRLKKRTPNRAGRVEAIICDFCATWQRGSNSAAITFQKSSSTQTFLCCDDLLCSLHVRDKTPAAKLSRTQLRETNDVDGRVERLRMRLQEILTDLQD